MEDEQQKHMEELEKRNDIITRERVQLKETIKTLENERYKLQPLLNARQNLEKNISELQVNLEAEQKKRVRDVNDKEREKFEAVKTLN